MIIYMRNRFNTQLLHKAIRRLGILFAAILLGVFVVSSHASDMPNLLAVHDHGPMETTQSNADCTVACTSASLQKVQIQSQPPIQEKEPIPPEFVLPISYYPVAASLTIAIYAIKRYIKVPLYTLHESLII